MMKTNVELLDEFVLQEWKKLLGDKFDPTKLAGYRMVSYCCNGIEEFLEYFEITKDQVYYEADDHDIYSWCPISLKDVWDNNGWVRIEPDGSNLPPTTPQKYWVYQMGETPGYHVSNIIKKIDFNSDFTTVIVGTLFRERRITHYKPVDRSGPKW